MSVKLVTRAGKRKRRQYLLDLGLLCHILASPARSEVFDVCGCNDDRLYESTRAFMSKIYLSFTDPPSWLIAADQIRYGNCVSVLRVDLRNCHLDDIVIVYRVNLRPIRILREDGP